MLSPLCHSMMHGFVYSYIMFCVYSYIMFFVYSYIMFFVYSYIMFFVYSYIMFFVYSYIMFFVYFYRSQSICVVLMKSPFRHYYITRRKLIPFRSIMGRAAPCPRSCRLVINTVLLMCPVCATNTLVIYL